MRLPELLCGGRAAGSQRVAYYRLYFISPDQHIQSYEGFEAPNDDDAVERADLRQSGLGKELWCQDRKICQWVARTAHAGWFRRAAG